MNLKDKVALVTGSSRGIGRAIARTLAVKGCKVIVHGSRQSEALTSSFEEVKKISPDSIVIVADFSDSKAIDEMFSKIKETFGILDILVNNAFVQRKSCVLDIEEKDWDFVLAVNLKAPLLCSQRAAKLMRNNNQGGKIINISSVHAYDAKRSFASYSISKAGLEILTKSLAMELAQYNIQANSLVLGAIATESTPPQRQEKLLSAIPANRIGTTEEVARLVAFLSSNQCDYITGASITVDGGATISFCATRPDL